MSELRRKRGVRVAFVGMAANTLLCAAKLTAGLVGHSYALVADAVESLADIFSSVVVWGGVVVAAEPADESHPYGHGKAEPIAASVVAILLLLASVGIAIQAIYGTISPRESPAPFTLLVLIASIVIKESLFRFVRREGEKLDSSVVRADAWHHRTDVITSLFTLAGIGVAIVGGPKYQSADSVAAIIAAGIIAWNGWRFLRPALDELMDAAPDESFNNRIKGVAGKISGVDAVEKCIARKTGYHYFVDMHVEVDPKMTVERAHEIAHQVKDAIRHEFPTVVDVLVHIEPSNTR